MGYVWNKDGKWKMKILRIDPPGKSKMANGDFLQFIDDFPSYKPP